MSQYYAYNWQVASPNAIALAQTFTANVPLRLNGAFGNLPNNTASIIKRGMVRAINLTCGGDARPALFTAIGTQNGAPVTAYATAANNGAAINFTNNNAIVHFDTIASITSNADPRAPNATVSVGTTAVAGLTYGFFPAILINTEKNQPYLSYALQSISNFGAQAENATSYYPCMSLVDITNTGKTYAQLIANGALFVLPIITQRAFITQYTNVIKSLVIQVANEQAGVAPSFIPLNIQFLQV